MTTIRRHTLLLALSLLALAISARAQTPSIEVSTDTEAAEFSAQGKYQSARVEVYAPSGELVFEADEADGQSIRWAMVNRKGERVADGVYLATITVVDSLGKKRKRIEQVTVSSSQYAPASGAPTPQESLAPTGSGTVGRIAKWTTSTSLGNSVITESVNKVGVNIAPAAPTAALQVAGPQPAALPNTGTPAATLLQTSGGKGGNTTASGKVAGTGAGIALYAGNGGDAPAGSTRGKGGNIVLQPGSTGAGAGVAGANGNLLLAPSGIGNVGIGTTAPAAPLTVRGATANAVLQVSNSGASTGGGVAVDATATGGGYGVQGSGIIGVNGLGGASGTGVSGSSTGGGTGVLGRSGTGYAGYFEGKVRVTGFAAFDGKVGIGILNPIGRLQVEGGGNIAVYGTSTTGTGVSGTSGNGYGIYGFSDSGDAVYGQSTTGYAGDFSGKVRISKGLEVIGGCTGCTAASSDRALKSNITAVDPRSVLDRLATLPIGEWNYKSDEPAVRHLGPMAQDFRAAFNLGLDDKHIDMIDASGVTMASIQALYQLMLEKDRQNQELNRKVERLQAQVARQQAQLNQVRRTIRRRAGKR